MDRNSDGLRKSTNGLAITSVLNIILGTIYIAFTIFDSIVEGKFGLFDIMFIVFGILFIYLGCKSIKEILDDIFELNDILFESHLGRFDDLKAIQDEIDKLVEEITREKIDKCECGSAMVITKNDKLVCRKCGAVIKETIKK